MPTEKRVPSLIVNTLTEAQYQALENPSDTEMWVTPYDESILPDQTGQSGKFLTTDGTDASWGDINALPLTGGEMHPATGQTSVRIEAIDNNENSLGELNFLQGNLELICKGDINVRADDDGQITIDASNGTGGIAIKTDTDDIAFETNGGDVTINGTILPILAAKASMPSSTYDTLTLGASGATYIAPSDGYFVFIRNSTAANQFVDMDVYTDSISSTYRFQTASTAAGIYCIQTVPAQKGASLKIIYNLAGSDIVFRFVYAEGSKSEA